jgi:serine/threonine protein kinase HipA of HipAB toxin-antitoxin module
MAPMSDLPRSERAPRWLPVDTRVEVRNRFDGSWAPGFTVAGIDDDGRYQVTRRSDGASLPTTFARDDIRRERSRQTWWV